MKTDEMFFKENKTQKSRNNPYLRNEMFKSKSIKNILYIAIDYTDRQIA